MSVVFRDARASVVALALMIVIAVCLAYASGLKAPFVLDDGNSITENKSIQSLWPIWPVVVYEHREGRTIDGRPLLNLSLALNLAATGMVPAGFRAVNIFIHCANALLLWGIARHLLSRPALPQPVQDMAGEIAFAGALLWAVHPLGTTAVT